MRPKSPARIVRDVGRRIAELRAQRQVTQEQLAEHLGVSVNYVQGVEAGRENLSLVSLEKWAKALRTKPIELLAAPHTTRAKVGRPAKR